MELVRSLQKFAFQNCYVCLSKLVLCTIQIAIEGMDSNTQKKLAYNKQPTVNAFRLRLPAIDFDSDHSATAMRLRERCYTMEEAWPEVMRKMHDALFEPCWADSEVLSGGEMGGTPI